MTVKLLKPDRRFCTKNQKVSQGKLETAKFPTV